MGKLPTVQQLLLKRGEKNQDFDYCINEVTVLCGHLPATSSLFPLFAYQEVHGIGNLISIKGGRRSIENFALNFFFSYRCVFI